MTHDARESYLPAAGHHWALPLYDPVIALIGGNPTRRVLVEQANLRRGHRVLEIGCGTGSVLRTIAQLHPDVEVVGLDPDPRALARASRKTEHRSVAPIQLDRGFCDDMPYQDTSFDRVLSSFMFHHLEGAAKEKTLREVRRVLKPGGSLHLLDFGGPDEQPGALTRWLHSDHELRDNTEQVILTLMRAAGFDDARKVSEGRMLLGRVRINYFRASVRAPRA